ncbi:hypothetical protein CR513_34203, partial [Mucuna pruriens]
MVMVKNTSDKWRMCIDYTDLNKACPNDPYPLPSIDRLVDGASRYGFLSFMDMYFGYNQIRMHPLDEAKTTFIIDNSIAPMIFKEQIGHEIKVYVDDMVVKSPNENRHCEALAGVFVVLRKHMLKLNLEKCSFDVQDGKFLGFMLTLRGIKANPKKCEVGINMQSPKNVKEV